MSIFEIDHSICPICGSLLSRKSALDQHDNLLVTCQFCGSFGITAEYYEDVIETADEEYKQRVKTFLNTHKSEQQRPLISYLLVSVPKGYKNYRWSQVTG